MLLSHLEYLVAVNKFGSMNRAARELFISQPTISNAFKSLEKELDRRIVTRTPSGIEFTQFGEQMIADSEIILNIINCWKDYASESQTILKVVFANSSIKPIFDTLTVYQQINPDIKIRLLSSTGRSIDILRSDDGSYYRFGFFLHTPNELIETKKRAAKLGMKIAKIDSGHFCLCINAANPLAAKDHIYISDIAGRDVLLKEGPVRFPYTSVLLDAKCDCFRVLGDHENMLLSVVNDPMLICLRPSASMLHDYYVSKGIIVVREIEDANFELNHYMVYPERSRMTPQERSFVDHIRTHAKHFEVV